MEKLSNEMLFEILSYLDFFDLIRCSRVSKSFRALTEDSTFDKTLFRSKAVVTDASTINIEEIRLNPAFDIVIYYNNRSKIKKAGFLFVDEQPNGDKKYRTTPLMETSAANLNATEPPLAIIYLDWLYSARAEQEVTVLDVTKELFDYRSGNTYFFEGWRISDHSGNGVVSLRSQWGSQYSYVHA